MKNGRAKIEVLNFFTKNKKRLNEFEVQYSSYEEWLERKSMRNEEWMHNPVTLEQSK